LNEIFVVFFYFLVQCSCGHCSTPDIKSLPTNLFDWGPFYIWGEKKGTVPDTAVGDAIPPVANPDNVTTPFNTQKIGIDVLANDRDDSNVPPTLTGTLSNQIWGTFTGNTVNIGTIDFTPMAGFTGSASAIYTIQDESNNTATGLLTVTIECIQDACEQHLVAYAPYNVAGDLKMYQSGSSSLFSWSGGNLTFSGVSGGGGVVVGTPWGYLQYNLAPLGIGSNLSIEMSVRGAALKRGWGPNFLFQLDNGLYSYIYNNYLTFWYYNSGYRNIKYINLSSVSLNPNDFYRVIYKVTGGIVNTTSILEIRNSDNNIVPGAISSSDGTSLSVTGLSNMYVWSRNNDTNSFSALCSVISCQWNDIIDSVKLYKY